MNRHALASLAALTALALGACSKPDDGATTAPAGPHPTLITATQAEARLVQRGEHSIGQVESKPAPRVAAEVDGRVVAVVVDVGQRVAQLDDRPRAAARPGGEGRDINSALL
jgi:multidrug efflux pump subunit AcrA (membrane-fusion protein)